MSWIERVHGSFAHPRRARVLAGHLASLLPPRSRVLDVGCGDGLLGRELAERASAEVQGIDVALRPSVAIPVRPFDGEHIPFPEDAFDATVLVDVLHHTEEPERLLREATRVARRCVLVKDHTLEGWLAGPTLRLMDEISNCRHGVELPFNYWRRERWLACFQELGLRIESWQSRLGLYPVPVDWVCGRSLHFVARLAPR